jgi:hypothetical protein
MAEETFPLDSAVRNFLSLTAAASTGDAAGAAAVSKKYQEAAKSAEEASAAKIALERQKNLTDLEAQQATRKAAQAVGVDPAAAADSIFETLSAVKKSHAAMRETAAIIAQKSAVRPHVDGIGAWISARASVGWDEERLEGQITEAKILSGQLAEMNQAIQQSAQTYRTLREPITAGMINEQAKVVAADANEKVAELAAKGFQYNLAASSQIVNASKDQMNALFQLKGAKNADVQLELAIHNSRRSDEQFDWHKEQRALEREAKKEAKTVDAKTLEYINLSEKQTDVPLTTAEDFSYQMKIDKKNPNLEYHLQNGRRIAGSGVQGVGATPLQSLENVRNFDLKVPEVQQETVKLIQDMEKLVQKDAKPADAEAFKKNPRLYEDAITKQTQAYMKTEYSRVRPGSVLDVGDLRSYIGTSAEKGIRDLFALPISQKVLLPLADAGQPLNDMKQVLGLATAAIRKGEITSSEAASGISQIMRKASSLNILHRGLNGKYGFVVPENGSKYNVQIGGFLNSQTIDMNSPVALNNYFARVINARPDILRQQSAQDEAASVRFGTGQ